jgi:hypothetical protein
MDAVSNRDGGDPSFQTKCSDPALHLWQASGITEQIIERPKERKIIQDALERLSQPITSPIQDSYHSSSPRGEDIWHWHRASFSSHPSYHHQQHQHMDETTEPNYYARSSYHNPPLIPPSQAIFISSSKAGVGVDGLLRGFISSQERLYGHRKNLILIDCDRGSHPDPHVPIIRALSAWADRSTSSRIFSSQNDTPTSASSEDTTFLNNFVQFFNEALEVKERRFIQTHIPSLYQVLKRYDLGKTNAGNGGTGGPSWSSSREQVVHVDRHPYRNSHSSFSSRHAETLYSCQKLATVFRPTFAKFVYSLTEAMEWYMERGGMTKDNSTTIHSVPTIIVFQNLHRGDEVLLETLQYLLRAQDLRPLERPYLAIVTYQQDLSNYMPPAIEIAFHELNRPQVQKTKMSLEPLDRSVLERRLEDLLQEDDGETLQALLGDGCESWLVAKKLEACVLNRSLTLDIRSSSWTFEDEVPHLSPFELSGLDRISPLDFQFLQIFSCLGMKTSKSILLHAQASDNLDSQLAWAVEHGFLLSNGNEEYEFMSEALRDLIYHGISDNDRPKFHYQIAENLWLSFDIDELDKHLVVVVENLWSGRVCLATQRRRIAVAQLCLRAGEQRAEVSAYRSAHFYFMSGIELLSDSWSEAYELCLALHSSACEVAFCLALWEDIMTLAGVIIAKAKTLQDEVRAHISKIYAMGTQGDCTACIDYGSSLLSKLGEPIPRKASRMQTILSSFRTSHRLSRLTDDSIMRLPAMASMEKISAMRTLNSLLPYAINDDYLLVALLVDKMIELTLKHGTSALSGVAFAMLASVQCW